LSATALSNTYQAGSTTAMLTYNSNTSITGLAETGRTTGIPITSISVSEERSSMPEFTGPYRISGWDLVNREPLTIQQPEILNSQEGKISDE